jgi:23S rRNA pseudouridine955/2504/2580 synthase
VADEDAGQRLDKTLAGLLPGVPRSRIFRLIRKGEVRVNGKRASPEQRLAAGDRVRVPPVHELSDSAQVEAAGGVVGVPQALIDRVNAAIVHEDERVLVLDKPAGLAVHGGSGLSHGVIEALRAARPHETLELAHRLDRDTSGILIIARRPAALRALHELLREGQVEKSYLALVDGRLEPPQGVIDAPIGRDLRHRQRMAVVEGGRPAATRFAAVERFAFLSLLDLQLETGRTHQIRVHLQYVGHPVFGDPVYGGRSRAGSVRPEHRRQAESEKRHEEYDEDHGIPINEV